MKFIRFIIMSLCIATCFCRAEESRPAGNWNWEQIENDSIAKKFLDKCKTEKECPSLGIFGWEEVREYWAKVPELKASREYFEKCNDSLKALLMQDEEYAKLMEDFKNLPREEKKTSLQSLKGAQSKVYDRLQKKSEAYRIARKNREDSLFESNIQTLEYIINDYKARGKIFPVDWIEQTDGHHHAH
jgi:hypothetical protein